MTESKKTKPKRKPKTPDSALYDVFGYYHPNGTLYSIETTGGTPTPRHGFDIDMLKTGFKSKTEADKHAEILIKHLKPSAD